MSFHSLEHDLIKALKDTYGLEEKDYWISCSGGLDSIVLYHLLKAVKPVFKFKLKALHVHHGFSKDEKNQSDYRDQALNFVRKMCEEDGIEFESFMSPVFLKSEEECRLFRMQCYEKKLLSESRVFLAHHQDDLFETLVIRLIRGTGPEGFKKPFSQKLERPFVHICGRSKLEVYQKEKTLEYLEDPSNAKTDYLRNWLRSDWLPQLEKTDHGLSPFKSSLIKLSEHLSQAESDLESFLFFEHKNEGYFKLSDFMSFNQVQKKTLISNALHKLKKSGYTAGQVLEVLKLLERKNQDAEFSVSGLEWRKTETKVHFKKT